MTLQRWSSKIFHLIRPQVLFAGLWLVAGSALAYEVPQLTQPVMDEAGILSPATESELNNLMRQVAAGEGTQLAVLTIPSLGGETIEQVGIAVADRWQLGTKAKDNGVIFLIAPNERRMRIEVGQGLEGDLPDAYAKRIISEVVTPYFVANRFDDGVKAGVVAIYSRTDPNLDLSQISQGPSPVPQRRQARPLSLLELGLLGLFLIFLLSTRVGRAFLWYALLMGLGRGGGGGGFGGSGRYGGRGGGFSGGGASGGW